MRSRAKTAVGIDVCRDRVHLALVARDAQGTKILRSASAPLPEGTLDNGDLVEMEILTRALRKLRRQAHIPRARAGVAMSISPLVLQLLDMPDPIPANVGVFVQNELQQYVALSGRKIVSDFHVAGGTARRLLAVATRPKT